MTTRLSAISLAGTARTLVAVGTCSDCSMLATTRAAAPRSVAVPAFSIACAAGDGAFAAVGFTFSAAGDSAGTPSPRRAAGVLRALVPCVAGASACGVMTAGGSAGVGAGVGRGLGVGDAAGASGAISASGSMSLAGTCPLPFASGR